MPRVDFEDALTRLRANDSTLTTLKYREYNGIWYEDLKALANAVKKNTILTKLNYNGDKGAVAVADALKDNNTLKSIKLTSNFIGRKGAIALANALKVNKSLTYLDLDSNDIGVEGAKALADGLKYNDNLAVLRLPYNDIRDGGGIAIANALWSERTSAFLYLRNYVGEWSPRVLANALKDNTIMTELDLTRNHIGDDVAKALANALKVNCALKTLDLNFNKIGDEGAKAFARALNVNCALDELRLQENNIGDEGAKALANAVKDDNTFLAEVYSRENNKGNPPNNFLGLLGWGRYKDFSRMMTMSPRKKRPRSTA